MSLFVARTYGGLGNQLFQVLYSRLVAASFTGSRLLIIHDRNYPHAFPLSPIFLEAGEPPVSACLVSRIRVTKILDRIGISRSGRLSIGEAVHINGYFRNVDYYRKWADLEIASQLERLRIALEIKSGHPDQGVMHHIRLGDVFITEAAEIRHLEERLSALPDGCSVMPNREELIRGSGLANTLRSKRIRVVPSGGESAEAVIAKMSRYGEIDPDLSTPAFWAACLGKRRLVAESAELNALYARFSESRFAQTT
jgi:hypothetical protein